MMLLGGFKIDLRGGACAGFPATGCAVSAHGCVGFPTAAGCVGVPTATDGALLENDSVEAVAATVEAGGGAATGWPGLGIEAGIPALGPGTVAGFPAGGVREASAEAADFSAGWVLR